MKRPVKIAICIGIVVVIVGIWNLRPADKEEPSGEVGPTTVDTSERPDDVTDHVIAAGPDESTESDADTPGRPERSFTPRPPNHPRPAGHSPSISVVIRDEETGAPSPVSVVTTRPSRVDRPPLDSGTDRLGPDDGSIRISTVLPDDRTSPTTRPTGIAETVAMSPTPTLHTGSPPLPTARSAQTHTIQAGDTFSALAKTYFGNAKYANLIARANPRMDPRRLFIGAKVNIPPPPEPVAASTTRPAGTSSDGGGISLVSAGAGSRFDPPPTIPEGRSYTIQPGESWRKLAKRYLGSGNRWTELYELNRERVPVDPRRLPVGAVIELPAKTVITTQ